MVAMMMGLKGSLSFGMQRAKNTKDNSNAGNDRQGEKRTSSNYDREERAVGSVMKPLFFCLIFLFLIKKKRHDGSNSQQENRQVLKKRGNKQRKKKRKVRLLK